MAFEHLSLSMLKIELRRVQDIISAIKRVTAKRKARQSEIDALARHESSVFDMEQEITIREAQLN